MLPEWKKPRGRRQTLPLALAIVHGMLDAGIMDTTQLARAAKVSRWNAWSIKRKRLAVRQRLEADGWTKAGEPSC